MNTEVRNDKRGFTSITHYLRINRKKDILKFIEEIGSSNSYKIRKIKKAQGMGPLGFEPRTPT